MPTETTEASSDYWLIAALDYERHNAWVMAWSPDCIRYDVADGSAVEDIADMGWAKDRMPGLYRLTLHVWADDTEMDISVGEVDLLTEFPH